MSSGPEPFSPPAVARQGRYARLALGLAAAFALADASIVTLGLPSILIELDSTVEGVALVLGVYTAVLAVALPGAALLARRRGGAQVAAAGIALFGAGLARRAGWWTRSGHCSLCGRCRRSARRAR